MIHFHEENLPLQTMIGKKTEISIKLLPIDPHSITAHSYIGLYCSREKFGALANLIIENCPQLASIKMSRECIPQLLDEKNYLIHRQNGTYCFYEIIVS